MSLAHIAALSIWEIAFRLYGKDPNQDENVQIPLEVQDAIRLITQEMYHHRLRSCDEKGIENWILEDVVRFEDYESPHASDENERYQEWYQHKKAALEPHNEAIKDLEEVFQCRKFDKGVLDNIYIFQPTFMEFIKSKDLPFPEFWADEEDHPEIAPTNVKPAPKIGKNQINAEINRATIRAVAQTLWDEHPALTIAGLIQHKALQLYGGGKQYSEKYLREMIKDLDPRPETSRKGRPPKKKPNS